EEFNGRAHFKALLHLIKENECLMRRERAAKKERQLAYNAVHRNIAREDFLCGRGIYKVYLNEIITIVILCKLPYERSFAYLPCPVYKKCKFLLLFMPFDQFVIKFSVK